MNNSNFFSTSSSDAYDESLCLYYDSIHGFKTTRTSLTIPEPTCTSVYGLSELENNAIRDIPPFISKHIKNNKNTHVSFNQSKPPTSLVDAHIKHYSSNYNPSYRKLPDDDEDLQPRPPPVPTRILSGSNLSAVLREKMPNNEIYYSQGKWHCGKYNSDVFPINQGSNFRICAKQKDNRFVERANTKRKLRTRSESDPNEDPAISSSNSSWYPIEDSLTVINVSNTSPIPTAALFPSYSDCRAKKLPATPKRHSPARVLLYNNNTSPRLVRNLAGHSSSPVRGRRGSSLNRLSEQRRSRTKSPPLSRVTSNDSLAEYDMHYPTRKSKSNVTAPVVGSVIKSMSDANRERRKLLSPIDVEVDRISDCTSVDDDADISDTESNFGNSYDSADSSDSDEDGYRSHAYKVTASSEKFATLLSSSLDPAISLSPQPSQESLVNPDSLLVPSLFPNVPPYLAFSSNTVKGPDVPADLFRILKWKVSTVMPKIVRHVLANSGVRLLKKTNDWMGTWGKHMKSNGFKTIRPYQKINHLPGSFKIGRKDNCWKNLQRLMIKYGKKEFGFMPKTYIIPNDLNILRKAWPKYAQRNVKWIIKPPASARGTGIRVVHRWGQIPKRRPLIVQRYIERPLLINGSKFDLRLYVLVTSINPLRVYMYHNGLARFASVKYSAKSDTLHERCMHLTNYSINKLSSNYSKNEDVNACHGHKWTIKSLMAYLSDRGVHTDRLWEALRNLVMRTLLAGEQAINSMVKVNVESKYSCFELFGFDVLLDADLVPWLLEVNISPSLHSELPLDTYVKAPLIQGVLNTALYNIPPRLSPEKQKEIGAKMGFPTGPLCFDKRLYINYLSRAEKVKHNQFTRKTLEDRDDYLTAILEHLTPDDVRCLIVAEDEFARCAPLERIFPTCDTHKYLKYTETPRYYNRLLDAWECRYAKNRSAGIQLLQQYCERKYHLEVPPSPTRKLSSPTVSDESAEEYEEGDEDTQSSDDLEEEIPCVTTRTLKMTRSTLALTTAIKAIRRKHRKLYTSAYKLKKNTTLEENDDDSENDEQL